VAIFTCPIDVALTETKGTVLIHNAKEMMDFSKGEEKNLEEVIFIIHLHFISLYLVLPLHLCFVACNFM
jgi:hypothetical protein